MKRTWQLGPFVDEDGRRVPLPDHERDREMVHLGWAIDRMGGSVVIAGLRARDQGGYVNYGLAIKYDSGNVPAVEAKEPLAHEAPEQPGPDDLQQEPPPEPPAEPVPEPEPALVAE